MDKKDYKYYLHKTLNMDNETVNNVFNNGLKSWYGTSMHSTLAPILEEDIVKFGLDYFVRDCIADSEEYNMVFLVKIPKCYMGAVKHRDGKIDPPIPLWRKNEDETTSFVPSLIQGVYYRDLNKAIENPNFSPIFDPSGLQFSDEQVDNMWSWNRSEWLKFHDARKNAPYEQLKKSDQDNRVWQNVIEFYSDKYGVTTNIISNKNYKK